MDSAELSEGDRCYAEVTPGALDLGKYVALVGDDGAGAIATFSGVTRNSFQGKTTERLEYEAYVPMAAKKLLVRRRLLKETGEAGGAGGAGAGMGREVGWAVGLGDRCRRCLKPLAASKAPCEPRCPINPPHSHALHACPFFPRCNGPAAAGAVPAGLRQVAAVQGGHGAPHRDSAGGGGQRRHCGVLGAQKRGARGAWAGWVGGRYRLPAVPPHKPKRAQLL